ncbi:MAG: cation transporter [Lachnospiraceae bacterium]|nr:cation transporter [Lachnospiraceae bacterium]MBQ8318407.1 cation transporter [Lachnospiraceae bacterium]
MTKFLVSKFIKDYDNVKNTRVREAYGVLSSWVGIICNILLFIAKFVIGTLANSISIVSDGFNNLSDCASCVVTMFGYKMAAKPADKDHPFGHGRMEYLTSLIIAMVIVVVGVELFTGSVDKILNPEDIKFSIVALVALIISILIKLWMGLFNRKLGRAVESSVMLATSKDSLNDVLATAATLFALVASLFTDAPLDGVMGIIVSMMILLSGFGIIKETVDELLGQPASAEMVEELKLLVDECSCSLGMHDLIIHSYGPGNLIGSVHIEVDGKGNIMDIHDAIDELERNIYDEMGIRMTVHMDPVETDNENLKLCKDMMEVILADIDKEISFHDFRVVAGPSHTNLIFDLVIPHDCKLSEKELKGKIDEKLAAREKKYYAVITFERSYY